MVTLLDKLLDFFASLKLAICLILGLAIYLASATAYESRYGTRAVQDVIYTSRPFILLMALLAINVMAAVLVRYPWKRKQTGFIITHAGIETLLLGCLLSFRYSIDGNISLTPLDKADPIKGMREVIDLNDEEVNVHMADLGGEARRYGFPISLWRDAGYPGMAKFLAGTVGLAKNPLQIRWPEGHSVTWPIGPGAKLTVLDWIPAAKGKVVIQSSPDGFPAAIVHIGGHMPNGMPLSQDVELLVDGQGHGMEQLNGGLIELDMWKARVPEEVDEFLNPPAMEQLPEMGRLAILIGGKRYAIDVTKDSIDKDQPLGDGATMVHLSDYTLHPATPQLPDDNGAPQSSPSTTIDPTIHVRLSNAAGSKQFELEAWRPQFIARDDNADAAHHGMAAADDPVMYYWHPQTYFTVRGGGTMGRLQMLQTPDGRLLAHLFATATGDGSKPTAPFPVEVGKTFDDKWAAITATVTQFNPSGTMQTQYLPAPVTPEQMDSHPRAIRVALEVDGERHETWLERSGGPVEFDTKRGPVQLDYSMRQYDLGFAVGLNNAEQTFDPGSDQAASFTSDVAVMGTPKTDGNHIITMNEPLTLQGMTFYQSGMNNEDGVTMSTLSVRYDPGWIIKYLGCAMIVGGIFTMFYMKAYFQKTPAPQAAVKKATKRREAVSA